MLFAGYVIFLFCGIRRCAFVNFCLGFKCAIYVINLIAYKLMKKSLGIVSLVRFQCQTHEFSVKMCSACYSWLSLFSACYSFFCVCDIWGKQWEVRGFMHFKSNLFVVWHLFVKLCLSPRLVFLVCALHAVDRRTIRKCAYIAFFLTRFVFWFEIWETMLLFSLYCHAVVKSRFRYLAWSIGVWNWELGIFWGGALDWGWRMYVFFIKLMLLFAWKY